MPRYAREKSESGTYHIMIRGINRQDIFEDNDDRQRFIETIKKYKTVSKYEVHGYCLMSNHVHMLIKEVKEPKLSGTRDLSPCPLLIECRERWFKLSGTRDLSLRFERRKY